MITVVVLMKEIFVSDFIVGIDKTSTPGKIIAQYWNVPAQSGTGKSHVMALTKSIKRHCHADRKSTRLNSSHSGESRMPSSA